MIGRAWNVWSVVPERAERRRKGTETSPVADRRLHQDGEFRVPLGEQWTQGWLAFSTTEAGEGGYDLFASRFDGSGKQSLDVLVPGLNSEKNELGAYFLPR